MSLLRRGRAALPSLPDAGTGQQVEVRSLHAYGAAFGREEGLDRLGDELVGQVG